MNINTNRLNRVERSIKDMSIIQKIMVAIFIMGAMGMASGIMIGLADVVAGPTAGFINSFNIK